MTSNANICSNFIWTLSSISFLQNDDSGPILKYCNLWHSKKKKTVSESEPMLSFFPLCYKKDSKIILYSEKNTNNISQGTKEPQ